MNPADVRATARPDFARAHGCALFVFDKSTSVAKPETTGGWYSIGGEPAVEFHRPRDLPAGVVWWTNLDRAQAWRLGQWDTIKPAEFLGGDWGTMVGEWGTPRTWDEFKVVCAAWSETLGRLGEWLSRWAERLSAGAPIPAPQAPPPAPWAPRTSPTVPNELLVPPPPTAAAPLPPDRHPQWSWGPGSFAEALAWRLGWAQTGVPQHPALSAAYATRIDTLRPAQARPTAGSRRITLSLPRIAHAQAILASRFPLGAFTELPPAEWPREEEERWNLIASTRRPVLVRFDQVLWNGEHDRAAALWWGRRGRRFSASDMDPVWLTGEEALMVRPWVRARPEAVLRAPDWDSVSWPTDWPIPPRPGSADPADPYPVGALSYNSLVSELLADNLWRAGATPARTPDLRVQPEIAPRVVWWRSADRMRTYAAAWAFARRGFDVLSWGEGTVTIQFHPTQVLAADWIAAVQESGVRVPVALARETDWIAPEAARAKNPAPFSPADIDAWLKRHHGVEARLWLDRLLWPWSIPDEQKLNDLLRESAKALVATPPPSDAWGKEWTQQVALAGRAAMKSLGRSVPAGRGKGRASAG